MLMSLFNDIVQHVFTPLQVCVQLISQKLYIATGSYASGTSS